MLPPRDYGERIAAAEEQLQTLEQEMLRVRNRIHDLESDRAALQLFRQQMQALTDRCTELAGSMEATAERAAEKTIAKALLNQDSIKEIRDDRRRDKIRTWLQAMAFGVMAGGFAMAFVFGLADRL